MNSDTHAGHTSSDHTDHAASPYQYKNEVRLTIGDAAATDTSQSKPIRTPEPSPRLYGSTPDNDRHSDDSASTHVPSPDNSTSDSGLLMRHSQSDDLSRVGLDNAAFESDATSAAAVTPLSSFGHTNGNGKATEKPTAEAVNLELVNIPTSKVLAPVNEHRTSSSGGTVITPKKQTTVNISDNYDEYFVPVNEHRKYMR